MSSNLYFYGRYAIGGIISYVAPRFLVALGVPVDRWIMMGANWFSLAITNEAALWGASMALFIVLFVILIILDRSRSKPPIMVYGGDTLVATGVLGPKPIGEIANQITAERDTRVDRVLAYIETGNWGLTFNEFMGTKTEYEKGSSFKKFRQAALDEKIRVWGKTALHAPYSLIAPEYWKYWQVEIFSCLKGECKSEIAESGYSSIERRYDLMVSKIEIEKQWPPKQ